ncbi:MAG: acyltransferase [Hamadaea sp.]|uniref:acyltransferase family protein n=1 Tax=Hamadaea sp. TaxID=2024425 RepID=UPI0017FB76FC|nr:acyltransferase [Hamadaea sp.]NUR70465.1 acyltransferase [Hamadaea sp.]NUT18264.1 acyltransferase [Hamadaea sp.]
MRSQELAPPAQAEPGEPMAQTAPEPSPMDRPARPRLRILDGLRLLAALAVVSWHLIAAPTAGWADAGAADFGPLAGIARYGWLGVELFFLISGFVIGMSSWGRRVGDFAASRVVRLYPAYWLAVLASAAVLALFGTREVTWPQTAANLTMLQNPLGVPDVDPSYWTLGVELRFYLLFAIVVALGVTYRRVVYFCVIWLAVSIFVSGQPWLAWLISAENVPYFVAGLALFLVHRFGGTPLLWGIVIASWLVALYRVDSHLTATLGEHGPAEWIPAGLIITGCFAVMSLIATGHGSRISWPWLVTAGALTYPLYLLHQTLGVTVIGGLRAHVPGWLLVIVLVAGLLGLAWLVHRYVERPLAAWLKRAATSSLVAMRSAR